MAATLGDISCHVTGQPSCPLAEDLQGVWLGWALLVYLQAETLISLFKVKTQQVLVPSLLASIQYCTDVLVHSMLFSQCPL